MSDIVLERKDGIATVFFNRPGARNTINQAMWRELARLTEELAKDETVGAVVYRGAGTDSFASGADVTEFSETRNDPESALRYRALIESAYSSVRALPQPSVAMIFGSCVGAGMGVALACDLRFAATGSMFGIPAAKLNVLYTLEAVAHLVQLVGPNYAKDLLFSARIIDEKEAFAVGLIERILPPDKLEQHTYEYLRNVVENAPMSVHGSKYMIESILAGLNEVHRRELHDLLLTIYKSEDHKEGTRAFLEKRRPRFSGH